MATFTILKQDFNISEEGKTTLEKYIERMNRAIIKYRQSEDEKEDIFQRIREKLETAAQEQGVISTGSIIRIMNEIGEGDDIFRDISENSDNTEKGTRITGSDVKDFFKREFHRNQKTGLILGVCSGIGETFEINPLWIRLLFILLTVTYGSGIIIYIFLAILMPDISRERKNDETPRKQKLEIQAEEFGEDIKSRVNEYSSGKQGIIGRFFGVIAGIISSVWRFGIACLRFMFFGGIAGLLLIAAIGLIIAIALLVNQPVLNMQSFFSYIPTYTPWMLTFGAIASIVLGIMFAAKAIGKEVGNFYILVICFIFGSIAIFSGTETFIKVIPHYANSYSKTISTDYNVASGSTISVDLEKLREMRQHNLNLDDVFTEIVFEKSNDDKIHIASKSSIRAGSKEEGDKILSKVIELKKTFSGGILSIEQENENNYSEVVPFSFLDRTVRIAIPETVSIFIPESHSSYSYQWYTHIIPRADMRAMGIHDCVGLKAQYNAENGAFVCTDDSKSLEKMIVGTWEKTYDEEAKEKRGLVLNGDHSISSINEKPAIYTKWEIRGTSLVLFRPNIQKELSSYTEDIFSIKSLGSKSLILEQDEVNIYYERE